MLRGKKIFGALAAASVASLAIAASPSRVAANPRNYDVAQQTAAPTRSIGTIESISGTTVTMKTDAGAETSISVTDATKILRIEPGQKDLSSATVIHLADLQVGDRILITGQLSNDGKSLDAARIVVMKKTDVEAKQQQEREAWQHGVGGLVKSTDPATGTIVIDVSSLGTTTPVTIHTTKETALRRYAPDSVKFDEAKLAPIEQIHAGDQLRARGARSANGVQFEAQEIVSGSFRNIAGTITDIDAAANTIRVNDLIAKKTVLVKFTSQSEIRQLPEMMARFIAARLHGGQPGFARDDRGAQQQSSAGAAPQGQQQRFQRRGAPGGPSGDWQQMLTRLPAAKISDLQKGEAVMLVSTEGSTSGEVTAITMLGGVEPILEAAPKGQQAMTLSPWSLSGPGEGDSN
jgi:transcription antitermination factor NusG